MTRKVNSLAAGSIGPDHQAAQALGDDGGGWPRPHAAEIVAHPAVPEGQDLSAIGDEQRISDAVERIAAAGKQVDLRDHAGAAETLAAVDLPQSAPVQLRIGLAEALARANQPHLSDRLFEELLVDHRGHRRLHIAYAKRLYSRGFAFRALELVEAAAPYPAGSNQDVIATRVRNMCDVLRDRGGPAGPNEDCRLIALKHGLAAYRDRVVADEPRSRIGRLSLITGGLGFGGAERQLACTAAGLEVRRREDGQVGGICIDRPIEVLVRSHERPGPRRDIYLDDLRAAKVEIAEIDRMPTHPPSSFGIEDPQLLMLLDYLPARVTFGIRRLVRHFADTKPDVVSLWQDGACLFAGFAAVIAGVPRIQLVFRGLPPAIRKHMFKPDYEVLYRGLAEIPGVQFVSNSKSAAAAYAEWLGIPVERFSILYNGVQRMDARTDETLDRDWNDFITKSPGATHVVGGVFRFDTDKRPLTWIAFAARYAKRDPGARFVIVGDGRMMEDAVRLAGELGVSDRILFVGHSSNVAYWMKKMDVLVLMSSFEGLPNVLIEAQYLGVPVVSTPAGGASECFVEGISGHILGCADKTDLEEACDKVESLLGRAQDPAIFDSLTSDFLDPNFSVSKMIEKFLQISCGRCDSPA